MLRKAVAFTFPLFFLFCRCFEKQSVKCGASDQPSHSVRVLSRVRPRQPLDVWEQPLTFNFVASRRAVSYVAAGGESDSGNPTVAVRLTLVRPERLDQPCTLKAWGRSFHQNAPCTALSTNWITSLPLIFSAHNFLAHITRTKEQTLHLIGKAVSFRALYCSKRYLACRQASSARETPTHGTLQRIQASDLRHI